MPSCHQGVSPVFFTAARQQNREERFSAKQADAHLRSPGLGTTPVRKGMKGRSRRRLN